MIRAEQRWLMVENIAHSLNGYRRSIDQPRDAGQASQRFKRQSQCAEESHELPDGFGATDDFISTVNDDAGKTDAAHHIHQRGDNGCAKESFDLNFDLPFGECTIAVGIVALKTIELDRSDPVEGFIEARGHIAGDFSGFNGLFARVALCDQRGNNSKGAPTNAAKVQSQSIESMTAKSDTSPMRSRAAPRTKSAHIPPPPAHRR